MSLRNHFFGVGPNKAIPEKLFEVTKNTMTELNAPPKETKNISATKSIILVGKILELRIGGFIAASNQRIFKALCYLLRLQCT